MQKKVPFPGGFLYTMGGLLAWLFASFCIADTATSPVVLPQNQNWLLDTSGDTTLAVPFQAIKPIQKLSIQLVSGDGDIVKRFSMSDISPGQFSVRWDGKDDNGRQVPDEAYTLLFKGTDKSGNLFTLDPRRTSGGELLQDLKTRVLENGHISYQLTKRPG